MNKEITEKHEKKMTEIAKHYEKFVIETMQSGKLPAWDTGEGYYSSSDTADIITLFRQIDFSKVRHFLDMGSGDGKIALLASLFTKATGIEIDENLHKKAQEIKQKSDLKCDFLCENYMDHDISKYDLIFINPDKPFYRGLEKKFKTQLTGKLLVYSPVYHPQDLKLTKKFTVNDKIIPQYEKK